MTNNPFITASELSKLIDNDSNVVIFDCSYHLPGNNRNAKSEFLEKSIPKANFFDIDEIADTDNPLPHMLPSEEKFEKHMRNFGVNQETLCVFYDSYGLFSAGCKK